MSDCASPSGRYGQSSWITTAGGGVTGDHPLCHQSRDRYVPRHHDRREK